MHSTFAVCGYRSLHDGGGILMAKFNSFSRRATEARAGKLFNSKAMKAVGFATL